MAGQVRAWRSKHIFVAVALLGSASVVFRLANGLFSGSRWSRARPGLAADISRGAGRGDGESTPATSDGGHDAFVSDPRKGDDTAAPHCSTIRRENIPEIWTNASVGSELADTYFNTSVITGAQNTMQQQLVMRTYKHLWTRNSAFLFDIVAQSWPCSTHPMADTWFAYATSANFEGHFLPH